MGKPELPTAMAVYRCQHCETEFKAGGVIRFDDIWEMTSVLAQYRATHSEAFHECQDGTIGMASIVDFRFRDPSEILKKLDRLVNPSKR